MHKPFVSIITVTYNVNDNILPTIKSIIEQKNHRTEIIVIDGGSTDGTKEKIEQYQADIDVFISEPDNGIYDAMNKAIDVANGEYLMYVNTGDILLHNPVDLLPELVFKVKPDLILFNVSLSDGSIFKSNVSFVTKVANTIHHQGVLYKNNINWKYNTNYKVYADFDLNQRILKNAAAKYFKIEKTICHHDMGGLSHDRSVFNENYNIVLKNQGKLYVLLSFLYFKWNGIKLRLSNK